MQTAYKSMPREAESTIKVEVAMVSTWLLTMTHSTTSACDVMPCMMQLMYTDTGSLGLMHLNVQEWDYMWLLLAYKPPTVCRQQHAGSKCIVRPDPLIIATASVSF